MTRAVDLPPEQQVDGGCRPRFERPVLFEQSGWNSRVTSCLRCGRVTLTESLTEEPRPHDVRCVGNRVMECSPSLLGWFDAWPRYAAGVSERGAEIYLPPGLRVSAASELSAVEVALRSEQAGLDRRARLGRVGYPAVGPPEALAPPLAPFEDVRQGLELAPDAPLDAMLRLVGGRGWARWVALPLLQKRPGYPAVLEEWLAADDAERRAVALELIPVERFCTPAILATLGALLRASSPRGLSLYGLLNVCDALHTAARPLLPELRATAKRIGDGDYYLRKRVEASIGRFEALT